MTDRFTLTNFRKTDEIEGWPIGGNRRGVATFTHETATRGQRIGRQTTGKVKYSTYYTRVCLADGSDNKTHYIGDCGSHLSVMACDMKFQDHTLFPGAAHFVEYRTALHAATA